MPRYGTRFKLNDSKVEYRVVTLRVRHVLRIARSRSATSLVSRQCDAPTSTTHLLSPSSPMSLSTRLTAAVLVCAAALSACADTSTLATAVDGSGAMSASANASSDALRDYIVTFDDNEADPVGRARALVARENGSMRAVYQHALKGFAARLNEQSARALQATDDVVRVELDGPSSPSARSRRHHGDLIASTSTCCLSMATTRGTRAVPACACTSSTRAFNARTSSSQDAY